MLESRNQAIDDLQREVKLKDKTLQERQEQLSILLQAMEQLNGSHVEIGGQADHESQLR